MSIDYRVLWLGGGMLAALLLGCGSGESPGDALWKEKFTLAQGGETTLPAQGQCRAILLFFVSHDCPISNGYAPEIKRLVAEYSPRGIAPRVVYAESDLKLWEAQCHSFEFYPDCPAILDPKLVLARRVGATVTPEAAILTPNGELLYRGRIDDQYSELGQKRTQVSRKELRAALEATLAGHPAESPRTHSVGCPIYFPPHIAGSEDLVGKDLEARRALIRPEIQGERR